MSEAVVTEWLFDAGELVPGLDGGVVAANVFTPPPGVGARPVALCCLAGGGLSRAYWDLRVPGDDTYSFARWSAVRGFPVITVDHLGVGDSKLPAGMSTPLLGDVIAADDAVFRLLGDELRRNGLGCHPIPKLRTVGVGHALGAVLTVRQQAVYRSHQALALLGFGTKGLAGLAPTGAARPDRRSDEHRMAKLALLMFGSPLAPTGGGEEVDSPTGTAMAAAATTMLSVSGLHGTSPDEVTAQLSRLSVPVLILNGDRDPIISGRTEDAALCPLGSASRVVAGTGHHHNIAETRHEFWAQVLRWAEFATR